MLDDEQTNEADQELPVPETQHASQTRVPLFTPALCPLGDPSTAAQTRSNRSNCMLN